MTREQLIRWCAVREKAADALSDARRHVTDLVSLAGLDGDVVLALSNAQEALSEAGSMLVVAKSAALGSSREAA